MANRITYASRPDLPPILMSNGSMAVFIKVLALAASRVAITERHRQFAAWIASHDQDVFGLGMVGFDVSEMPWSKDAFDDDRSFMLAVVAAAQGRTGWDQLDHPVLEVWLQPCLGQFRSLMEVFTINDACDGDARIWSYGGRPSEWLLCPLHQVYLHAVGCVVCHDQSPWMSHTQH